MRSQGHRAAALLAGLLATAALATGCGSSGSDTATGASADTVDDAQVESGLDDKLSTSSATVSSAKCPTDVKVEEGGTFTCTVTFDNGATGKATVTQKGRNRYSYELKAGSVEIPGTTAAAAVEKSLAAQGAPNATVVCPTTIIVKVGTTVTCNVSSAQGGATGTVTFTFSDDTGTVDTSSIET